MSITSAKPVPAALWTVTDVMAYLRCGRSWVYDQVAKGGLPHLRVGGLRFVPAEVEAWALKHRSGSVVVPLRYSPG